MLYISRVIKGKWIQWTPNYCWLHDVLLRVKYNQVSMAFIAIRVSLFCPSTTIYSSINSRQFKLYLLWMDCYVNFLMYIKISPTRTNSVTKTMVTFWYHKLHANFCDNSRKQILLNYFECECVWRFNFCSVSFHLGEGGGKFRYILIIVNTQSGYSFFAGNNILHRMCCKHLIQLKTTNIIVNNNKQWG